MNPPTVSVVIPTYNQAEFLGEAIQSVLDQTYTNFECIVVNDGSPDQVAQVVAQFTDSRLFYLEHEQNWGLPAARNTGMRAARGELIALLDSDDIFHHEKLARHVAFMEQHPEVGVSYNGRFNLNHSASTIREIWRPAKTVSLKDLLLGFPFSPSDMVIRREWASDVNYFDEQLRAGGEDLDLPLRLALAGCQFTSVDHILNYRRYHSQRRPRNLPKRLKDVYIALDRCFADSRLPNELHALRDQAFVNKYLALMFLAFFQQETVLGQRYMREILQRDPSIAIGTPSPLMRFLMQRSIADIQLDHSQLLQRVLDQMPPELIILHEAYPWAVGYGHLWRGTQHLIWGRTEQGETHLAQTAVSNIKTDAAYFRKLAQQLLAYEATFGQEATKPMIATLLAQLKQFKLATPVELQRLQGTLAINRAFQSERKQEQYTISHIMQAVRYDRRYLTNRGVLAILLRSLLGLSPKSL